jgi:hypothetical protein
MTQSQDFDSHNDCEINEPVSFALQTTLGKKPRCICAPRKSLEEVVDVLKEKVSSDPVNEPNKGFNDKPVVKKIRKRKKYDNSNLSFMNKRAGRLISKSL